MNLPLDEITKGDGRRQARDSLSKIVPRRPTILLKYFRTVWNHARRTGGSARVPNHGNRVVRRGAQAARSSRISRRGGERSRRWPPEPDPLQSSTSSCSTPGSEKSPRRLTLEWKQRPRGPHPPADHKERPELRSTHTCKSTMKSSHRLRGLHRRWVFPSPKGPRWSAEDRRERLSNGAHTRTGGHSPRSPWRPEC
jgi:hypothetical protein